MATAKLFVPTRVAAAGYRHLAVHRSGKGRAVAFETFESAQRASDVLTAGHDLIHVVAGMLTYKLPAVAPDACAGPIVVHEVDSGDLAAADVCDFLEPNVVEVLWTIAPPSGEGVGSEVDQRVRLSANFELEMDGLDPLQPPR